MFRPAQRSAQSAFLGLSIFLLVLAVAITVVWVLPLVLTADDVGILGPAERLKAQNDVRTSLVALLVAIGAGVTVAFTVRTYVLNRESQVTDRFSAAVTHLGDKDSVSVRIGGLYALERIASDSERDRDPIIHVIGTFVTENSRRMRVRQSDVPEDVAAGLLVLGRLMVMSKATVVDLRSADLRGADLRELPSERTRLEDAKLSGAQSPEKT